LTAPTLSIIIPAHNEETRLPSTLKAIAEFAAAQSYSIEVLIVENGSRDRTLEIASRFAADHPNFRAIQLDGRGKGLAVQAGMLAAKGQYRFMCDADLSMPVGEISRFIPPLLNGVDVAIGSREAPGAVRYHEPTYRHWGGRVINLAIRLLALPGLNDTQCGFKCFSAAAAEDLFACQTMPGWSFDVEILYVARKRGYRILEVPIPWYFYEGSKVNAIQDALKMTADILVIRRNDWAGRYRRVPG
jgi:glycosyltransferase involved in cell wall biosynthesis